MPQVSRLPLALERSGPRAGRGLERARRWFLVAGTVMAALGVYFALRRDIFNFITTYQPFDLNINLVGTRRILADRSPYDVVSAHRDAVARYGRSMAMSYRSSYTSFIAMPGVAVLHVPFLLVSHATAVACFRALDLAGVVASLVVVARTLPRPSRPGALLVGFGALFLSMPLVLTLAIGQFHGVVMLGLASCLWGVVKDRPWIAGVGIGFAVAVKLTPILIVVYLLFRGYRRILVPAASTIGGLCLAAALLGQPSALLAWALDVLPGASGGTRYFANQSVPGWVARLVSGETNFAVHASLGSARAISVVVLGLGCVVLWWTCQHHALRALELGLLIPVLLLAGPLSWNHYFVWLLLPIVLLCDESLWLRVAALQRTAMAALCIAAVAMLAVPVEAPTPRLVAESWLLRITGSPYPVAALLILGVGLALVRTDVVAPAQSDDSSGIAQQSPREPDLQPPREPDLQRN
jgi:alpha-1,2-mannosyltransferase